MITTPFFEKYRQGDFIQYMNNVLQILNETRATQFNLGPQRDQLQTAMQQLNQAWQPQMGSELTPEIAEIDRLRDSAFIGFKLTVDNWGLNHYDAAWRNAAFVISDNIARHGDRIPLMRYQQQTATINAVIKDLEHELAPQVELLGLQSWLEQIKMLNNSFDQKYVARAQGVSGQQPGLIQELMNGVLVAFRTLKTLFEARFAIAQADAEPNMADFRQIENEWSSITQQYNDSVTRSYGAGQPEPPATDTPLPNDNSTNEAE